MYANFVSELFRARQALPPEIEKRAENFDVEKLEWFTKDWKLKASRKTAADVEVEPDISRQLSEEKEKEFDCENDIPVENVQKQLGFTKRSQLNMGCAKLPFLRKFRNSTFGATEMFYRSAAILTTGYRSSQERRLRS